MTFIEKLKSEYPDQVETSMVDMIPFGCPWSYGYIEKDAVAPCNYEKASRTVCKMCWNREMPEAENAESRRKEKIEELNTWCENSKCEECPIYKIIDFVEVCDFDSMPEERLDDLYEAIRTAKKKTEPEAPAIKSSGNRREFETGL